MLDNTFSTALQAALPHVRGCNCEDVEMAELADDVYGREGWAKDCLHLQEEVGELTVEVQTLARLEVASVGDTTESCASTLRMAGHTADKEAAALRMMWELADVNVVLERMIYKMSRVQGIPYGIMKRTLSGMGKKKIEGRQQDPNYMRETCPIDDLPWGVSTHVR